MESSQAPVSTDHAPATEMGLDEIIVELNRPYDGILPEAALRAARGRWTEVAPRLIELVRDTTSRAREGIECTGDGPLFAMYFFNEFGSRESLPAMLEAVSLPDDGPYRIFGDGIHEGFRQYLAHLCGESPDEIARLVDDRRVDQYVRWAAANAYFLLVRDGKLTREEAVERLRIHLLTAIAAEDDECAVGVVCSLCDYSPHEAFQEIETAYRVGLVDEGIVDLADVERSIRRGEREFQDALAHCPPTVIADSIEVFRGWWGYQKERQVEREESDEPSNLDDEDLDPPGFFEPPLPAETIRRERPRVGRNDPCPCGSGRKFKKCCRTR